MRHTRATRHFPSLKKLGGYAEAYGAPMDRNPDYTPRVQAGTPASGDDIKWNWHAMVNATFHDTDQRERVRLWVKTTDGVVDLNGREKAGLKRMRAYFIKLGYLAPRTRTEWEFIRKTWQELPTIPGLDPSELRLRTTSMLLPVSPEGGPTSPPT